MTLSQRRRAAALLVLAVALPIGTWQMAGVFAAPAASLFPLTAGATWVRVDEEGTSSTSRVVGPKTVGGRQCTVIERRAVERGRERVSSACFAMTATELLVIETTTPRGDALAVNPARPIMKLPPRAGLAWSWSPSGSAALKLTDRWIAQETVKVKAGTFRAWKLETVTKSDDAEITAYTWYAPGVGAVKNERKGHRRDRQISASYELASYKVP